MNENTTPRHALHKSPISLAIGAIGLSVLILLIIFHATTPLTAGPFGMLSVFVLLYGIATATFFIIIKSTAFLLKKLGRHASRGTRRPYYVASVLGFIPVLYLTLSSMGRVTVWGISLICLFIGLSLFYVLRRL